MGRRINFRVKSAIRNAEGPPYFGRKVARPFAWLDGGIVLTSYAGAYADYYFNKEDAAAGGIPLASARCWTAGRPG